MKKVHEVASEAGMVKVFFDSESCEYVAKAYAAPALKVVATYHTSDKEDAKGTAVCMLAELATDAQAKAKAAALEGLQGMTSDELSKSIATLRNLGMMASANELQEELDRRDVLAEVVEAAKAGDLGAQMALAEAIEVPTDADLAYINANEALVTAEQEARSVGMEVALHKSCHSSLSLDFSYSLKRYQTSGSVQELWYVKYFAAQIIAGADYYG